MDNTTSPTPQHPAVESAVNAIYVTRIINGKPVRIATTPQDFADSTGASLAEISKALIAINEKLDKKVDAVPAVANPPAQPTITATMSHEEACRAAGLVPSFGTTLGFTNRMVTPMQARMQAWASLIGVGVGGAIIGSFLGYMIASGNSDD